MSDKANRSILAGLNKIGWGPGKGPKEAILLPTEPKAPTFSRFILVFGDISSRREQINTEDIDRAIEFSQTRLWTCGYTGGELLIRDDTSKDLGARPYRRLLTNGYENNAPVWAQPIDIESEPCRMTGRMYR